MYSVVLATVLMAGSATPDWHNRCHSCYSGYSCYAGYSCYSGYSGYGCYSCYSSCHGCHGIFPIFHRHSCHGCCSTYVYSSCHSCSVCSRPVVVYSAPICCGGVITTTPRVIEIPAAGNPELEALRKENERLRKELQKKSEKVPAPKGNEEVSAPVSSRVTVTLPSDARLWVENVECPLTSSVRSFNTPALNPNQQYVYNLKVTAIRDGQTVSQTQRVIITPGQEARVDFNGAAVGTAAR